MDQRVYELAQQIDHTMLKPFADERLVIEVCEQCREHHFKMIAANSAQTALCAGTLRGSGVHVGAAIGFPLGQTSVKVKCFETLTAIEDGADEIDYVINLTNVKNRDWEAVEREMIEITKICHDRNVLCKAIFENCYLTKDEIRTCAEFARKAGPDFIKTSTGFGTSGAAAEDIRLMKAAAGNKVEVKAAGGIRDLESLMAMKAAGATRFGTSSGIAILEEYRERLKAEQ